MHSSRLLTLACIFLAACTPIPTSTPAQQINRVITTPAFEGLVSSWVQRYPKADGVRIELLVAPLSELAAVVESGEADVAISGAIPPSDWFATSLSREPLAIAVHPSNPVRSYSLDDLSALFSGRILNWNALEGRSRTVQPIIPFTDDELREYLDATLLAGTRPSATALLAPSPAAMVDMIAEDAGAIGLLPHSSADAAVRVVRVEGVLPSIQAVQDGAYSLSLMVSAFAPDEPTGILRDWLVWIQTSQPEPTPE